MTEKEIKTILLSLSKRQLMQFALSCIDRTIGLYKQMEEYIGKLPESKNYNSVISILEFVRNDIYSASKEEVKVRIKKCNKILDYLTDLEDWFAIICVTESLVDIMTYYQRENIDNIFSCIENNLEAINQLKSDEYVHTVNADASNEELEVYLTPFFGLELQIEYQIIEMIKNNVSQRELGIFIDNNKFNVTFF